MSCKLCGLNGDLKGQVEGLLRNGKDYEACQKLLEGCGIMTTLPGIRKHALIHMEGGVDSEEEYEPSGGSSESQSFEIDIDALKRELGLDLDIEDGHELLYRFGKTLVELWTNQAAIVYGLQKKYIEGEGGLPDGAVRMLNQITGMVADLGKINVNTLNRHLSRKAVESWKEHDRKTDKYGGE